MRDAERLQQAEADGHPREADAEDHEVLPAAQGHPKTYRS